MLNDFLVTLIIIFVASIGISYGILWFFILTPLSNYFKDPPGNRKIHQRIVPRIGGVCLVIAFVTCLYGWHMFTPSIFPHLQYTFFTAVIFATVCILIVGILDDCYAIEIQNKAKFLLELLIASEIVFLLGVRLDIINIFGLQVHLGVYGIPITILWIVGVANATNIIDGIDGLAGSIVLTGVIAAGLISLQAGSMQLVILCTLLSGIILGFLMHNRPPARAFLGDTGSLFLGMMLGLLSVKIVSIPIGQSRFPFIIMMLIAGLPILDVSVAMIRRFFKAVFTGVPWYKAFGAMTIADNDHIHHRLIYRGLQHAEATLLLALFNSIICIEAILCTRLGLIGSLLLLVYGMVITGWLLYHLDFVRINLKSINFNFGKSKISKRVANIGVVQADEILYQALANYSQDCFCFQFNRKGPVESMCDDFSAVIVVNNTEPDVNNDRDFAYKIASVYKKPVILISDFPDSSIKESFDEDSLVFHATRPVYVPALLNELYNLIRHKPSGHSISHRLINVTRLNPTMNGIANVKKI